jgi:nucleotide-binding universal stress UspA family protein
MFEIPAGGRRYRALELLVKQKRLSRTAPIPCVVRTEGFAEEDSLAACAYQAIIDTAKERGCDLIVMASHGRRGVSAIVLGSETIKVLIHGTIPVIVVRSQNASQYFAAS